jgi:hypothetical protein
VFSAKKRKTVSLSSQEDASVMNSYNDGTEPPNQPQVKINGNTLNLIQYRDIPKTIYGMYN